MGIPSSGLHSNGFLVRSILKINKMSLKIKNELLVPTKIYSPEILKLVDKNCINACAHITGGGLVENLLRSVPENFQLKLIYQKFK